MLKSNFFDTKKTYKELFLLLAMRDNAYINQTDLADIIGITPAMVSRYINDLEKRSIIRTQKNNQKDYRYSLTGAGTEYLSSLINLYIKDISRLKKIFQKHSDNFRKDYELKVAATNSFGNLIPYIAKELGFFEKSQMNIDLSEYSDGEKLMEEYEKNKFDIVLLGSAPAYLWKTFGAPIRIIASINYGGHAIIVRKQSNINDIPGLKGRTVIIPESTTVTSNLFRLLIKKHDEYKMDYYKDLKIINVDIEKIEEEFLNGKADALIAWEPYISKILYRQHDLKIIYDFSQSENRYVSNIVAVNDEFYSTYEETVGRFIDTLKMTIDYHRQKPEEVNRIIAAKLAVPEAVVQNAYARTIFEINDLI